MSLYTYTGIKILFCSVSIWRIQKPCDYKLIISSAPQQKLPLSSLKIKLVLLNLNTSILQKVHAKEIYSLNKTKIL